MKAASMRRARLTLIGAACAAATLSHAAGIDYVTTRVQGEVDAVTYDSTAGLTFQPYAGTEPHTFAYTADPANGATGATAASIDFNDSIVDTHTGIRAVGIGFASADLSTATLRASAGSAWGYPVNSIATMRDRLTFSNTTGSTALITLSFAFDGTATPGAFWRADVGSIFCFGAAVACQNGADPGEQFAYLGSFATPESTQKQTPFSLGGATGWQTVSITPGDNDASRQLFSGTFALATGTSTEFFSATLNLYCGGALQDTISGCDFTHTGTFAMGLPAGVNFSSDSGVLLAVPEPSTTTLMLAGFSLAAFIQWRRHRPGAASRNVAHPG